jgi:hypothetical protein
VFGKLTVPVPSLICLVAAASHAMKATLEVMFSAVGDVLPDIAFRKAQFVGKQEGFAVLLQRLSPILLDGMDRHREKPELHWSPPQEQAFWSAGRASPAA